MPPDTLSPDSRGAEPSGRSDPLAQFDPVVASWFRENFANPTQIQEMAWPRIAAGEHVLLSAPTGSGKTLTAFLWALSQLASGTWPTGETSVLYVSPLKALNNDIRTNLGEPLSAIRSCFAREHREFPDITVGTRSGDTPQSDRQRMVRHPPEILITTPESLNLILSSVRARHMLATVRTVILDEIHAVIDTKRGTHLITAVERMTLLSGEFQRIAISATVRPMELVAQFVGGYRRVGDGLERRQVTSLAAPRDKKLELSVRFPRSEVDEPVLADTGPSTPPVIWPSLVEELNSIINANRSTLIFVTTRRHAEKLTELLNEGLEYPVAYAHHGSLSREIRAFVEQSLKGGRLRAIVATNSLELGIDIGQLDQVVLVKTPMSVSSTLQRVGRAGHQVNATSRGVLFPLYGRDAVDAAVMSRSTLEQDIEAASPVVAPLDVLAQQLISMTAMERWDIDELYQEIRTSWPYRGLERNTFDLVIEMLAGRYADTRIRELRPRVVVDRVENTAKARDGVLPLLYQSGGTIPNRGYFGLRLAGEGAKVGELDEEFVWERKVNDTFYLGSQLWTITGITDRDVEVIPGSPGDHIIPFWKAEAQGRGSHYARLTMEFLEECEAGIVADCLEEILARRPELEPSARQVIADTLAQQRAATATALPHRHNLVVEHYHRDPAGRDASHGGRHGRRGPGSRPGAGEAADSTEIIVHCPWGMGVTQPLSLVIAALWEEERGFPLEVFADDGCMVLLLPADFNTAEAFGPAVARKLLRSGRIEVLLRRRLEQSGLFGALFRENAGRALLLPKGGFDRRMPLWLNRVRSKKLLGAVKGLEDFPILLETWRTCLQDRFDLESLRVLLAEIASGAIEISECETSWPSPFASEVVWRQTNRYMYLDDELPGGQPSNLSTDLLREAARNAAIRPDIPADLVDQLERRLQRLEAGYAPSTGSEIVEWVKERVAIPAPEVASLREAFLRDAPDEEWQTPPSDRLCWIVRAGADSPLLVAIERLSAVGALAVDLSVDAIRDLASDRWWEPPTSSTPSAELADLAGRFLERKHQGLGTEEDGGQRRQARPAGVLAQWLRFYGPREIHWPALALGLDLKQYDELLSDLSDSDAVIVGSFVHGIPESQVCDADNLEHLLAMLRRAHRPVFTPVSPDRLVGLWASTTGIGVGESTPVSTARNGTDDSDPDHLVHSLERLFGYPAPVQLWETDIIPSRLSQYYPVWLDGLFKETGLTWFGAGSERIAFGLAEDVGLYRQSRKTEGYDQDEDDNAGTRHLLSFLNDRREADFWEIKDALGVTSEETTQVLWEAAWARLVSNDSFETVRRGALTRFVAEPAGSGRPARPAWPGQKRTSRGRGNWTASRPLSGRWFLLDPDQSGRTEETSDGPESDPIAVLEMAKEKARIVLGRYGIVFRALLDRELPALRWGQIFTALRMMELSGEVVAGGFVRGLPGIQFALPRTVTALSNRPVDDQIIWMSAADPASPCGLPLGDAYPTLPSRLPSNHLVFRGPALAMISRRNGAELSFLVEPDDPEIGHMLAPLRNMVARRWNPRNRVSVEQINDVEAPESPYADSLLRAGFRRDIGRLVLNASYH